MAGVETLLAKNGNQTLGLAREDWLKKSIHILFIGSNYHPLINEIKNQGFTITFLSSPTLLELIRVLINREINIVHQIDNALSLKIHLAKLLSTPKVAIPPLFLKRGLETFKNLKELIGFYKAGFRKRKYL